MTFLPKEIFTYWHQGEEAMPPVVDACIQQIRLKHPSCQVRVLDSTSIAEIRGDIPLSNPVWESLGLPFKSDLIRTALLIRHGGIWMDPTVFAVTDVWAWLQTRMRAGIFMFQRPSRDRLLSNWFIAAEPNHPILVALLEKLCRYWQSPYLIDRSGKSNRKTAFAGRIVNRNLTLPRLWLTPTAQWALKRPPYPIYHYALYDLLCCDPNLEKIWKLMPVESAIPSHALPRFVLRSPLTEAVKAMIDAPPVSVFKLSWKLPEPQVPVGSVLDYLFAQSEKQLSERRNAQET